MRATEIIRGVIDLIDQIECPPVDAEVTLVVPAAEIATDNPLTKPADQNHFKQIFDLLSAESNKMYSNSPAEVVAGIESVTTNAGGGWMGPKNPADLRAANSFSMYPNFQAKE